MRSGGAELGGHCAPEPAPRHQAPLGTTGTRRDRGGLGTEQGVVVATALLRLFLVSQWRSAHHPKTSDTFKTGAEATPSWHLPPPASPVRRGSPAGISSFLPLKDPHRSLPHPRSPQGPGVQQCCGSVRLRGHSSKQLYSALPPACRELKVGTTDHRGVSPTPRTRASLQGNRRLPYVQPPSFTQTLFLALSGRKSFPMSSLHLSCCCLFSSQQ